MTVPRPFVWRKVRDFRPDIVHVVNPFFLGPFGLMFAKRLGVPTLASFHTDIARYAGHYGVGFISSALWAYMRNIHNRADVNLCPSTAIRKDLIDMALSVCVGGSAALTPNTLPLARVMKRCAPV